MDRGKKREDGEGNEGTVRAVHDIPVPTGDGPYVHAKRLQVIEKDYKSAILWFWKAINSGDRVDSALKDMVSIMKQTGRTEEAIEAVISFRHLCSKQAQEPLDNLLIDLYKKSGQYEEQIKMYKRKLRSIYQGEAFKGKTTKTARSHGKKFRVSVEQESARILGNIGWAYMQLNKYDAAEMVYRKALQVKPDANMACNLAHCLLKKGSFDGAFRVLDDVVNYRFPELVLEEGQKAVNRAEELMKELQEVRPEHARVSDVGMSMVEELMKELQEVRPESARVSDVGMSMVSSSEEEILKRIDLAMGEWTPFWSRRLPIFEDIAHLWSDD